MVHFLPLTHNRYARLAVLVYVLSQQMLSHRSALMWIGVFFMSVQAEAEDRRFIHVIICAILPHLPGAGYPPGVRIRQLLKQQRKSADNKAPTPVALTWYTVWDNQDHRMMMAQPNWEWPSRGIRMFINGTEVKDGDLFQVKPGLYPVMCWVPVRGGYNLQAPHLREVSQKELLQEFPKFSYRGMRLDPQASRTEGFVHYLAEALSEQARIYLEHTVDASGYDFHHSIDFTLPFITAMRHAQQQDWLHGTGFDHIVDMLAISIPYVEQLASAKLLEFLTFQQSMSLQQAQSSPDDTLSDPLGDLPKIMSLREELRAYFNERVTNERLHAERRAVSRGKSVSEAVAKIRQPMKDLPLDLVMSFLWLDGTAVEHEALSNQVFFTY